MSQQRIWTEVPQADTKATPDSSDEEKENGLCQTSSPLDSRWVEESVVFWRMHHAAVCVSPHAHHYMGYSFRLAVRNLCYMHHPTDMIEHTTAFVIPVVVYWLERDKPTILKRNLNTPDTQTLILYLYRIIWYIIKEMHLKDNDSLPYHSRITYLINNGVFFKRHNSQGKQVSA